MSTPADVRPLRWGIAATGKIAASMCDALATIDDAEVVAVGSRTQERADDFAARYGIARAHGSYDALWDDPEVDIVYVASPHSHHHAMTIAALDAGKHVLCEKAFSLDAGQARDMVEAARRNDRFLMEAMWTWFIPAVVEVRRRVAAGDIGEPTIVDANFGIRVSDTDGRHRRPDLAGGALLDLGVYPIGLARFLLGEPVGVAARGTLTDAGVDATVAGALSFEGGAVGVFHTTLELRTNLGATVYGTEGRIDLEAPFWFPTRFTVHRDGHEPERVEIAHDGLAHEARHAIDRIRDGHRESDVVPLATTVSTMELLDEIRRQVGVVYPGER